MKDEQVTQGVKDRVNDNIQDIFLDLASTFRHFYNSINLSMCPTWVGCTVHPYVGSGPVGSVISPHMAWTGGLSAWLPGCLRRYFPPHFSGNKTPD